MRDFQDKVNLGGGPDTINQIKFGSGEFNSITAELQNSVIKAGLDLTPDDGTNEIPDQLAQSLFLHSTKAQTMNVAGTSNVIELTPKSGVNGVVIPDDYTNMDGVILQFIPLTINTGDVTLSIGQDGGTQLPIKKVIEINGNELASGTIALNTVASILFEKTADGGAGAWLFLLAEDSVPTGMISMFPSATAPTGYLNCDGAEISRVAFVDLFDLMGTTYGPGNGSTTFNLPDMRSRSPVGNGPGPGFTNRSMGSKGGEENHALSEPELPNITVSDTAITQTAATGDSVPVNFQRAVTKGLGSGVAHNTMHPFLTVNFIIRI